ncbi:hypothetical protein F5Y16DRAFT_377375 [Xylariaceae sp. FL0255]|nr:hypothetical protein F5Y16DRAFT_377375 [Xylariaceae sp. FL0255]
MGWMWSSQGSPSSGNNNPDTSSSKNSDDKSPSKTPEPEYSDPEIAKFMALIQEEFGSSSSGNKPALGPRPSTTTKETTPKPSPQTSSSSPSSASSSWSSWLPWGSSSSSSTASPSSSISLKTPSPEPVSVDENGTPHLDPVSESLLPISMSCRDMFDRAFHCNSVGGQWTSVYREGSMRSCSEHWDDFWFCMRTRAFTPGPIKEEAIRAHYRKKEYLKYHAPGKPNSTDVWEARTEKVRPDEAFSQTYEKPDISDDEWRKADIERRRNIHRQGTSVGVAA